MVSGHVRLAKAQISLRIRAVWSGPSLSANRIIRYYRMNGQTVSAWMILCACAVGSISANFAHVRMHFFAWRGLYIFQHKAVEYGNAIGIDVLTRGMVNNGGLYGRSSTYDLISTTALFPEYYEPCYGRRETKLYLRTCVTYVDSDHPAHAQKYPGRTFCSVQWFRWRQWRPWSDCVYAQSDLGLRCPYMPEPTHMSKDMFSPIY